MSTVIQFTPLKSPTLPDLTTIKDLSDIDKYIYPTSSIDEFGTRITSPNEFRAARFDTETIIGSLTDFERGIVNLLGYISTNIQQKMDIIFKEIPTFKLRMYTDLVVSKHLPEISLRTSLLI